jgi:hypothetical protein
MQAVRDGSIHSLVNNFVTNVWGEENFTPAIVSSTGFVLATKSVAGALSYVGSPDVRISCDLTYFDLHEAVEARRGFRETMLASFVVTAWNLTEVVFYTIAGLVTLVAFQDKQFLSLAAKSVIQFSANSFYGVLGFLGQFSPTLAVKVYVTALEHLFKVQPDILQISKEEFTKNLGTLSEGLVKALGKREEDLDPVRDVLEIVKQNIPGIEAELVSYASDLINATV